MRKKGISIQNYHNILCKCPVFNKKLIMSHVKKQESMTYIQEKKVESIETVCENGQMLNLIKTSQQPL